MFCINKKWRRPNYNLREDVDLCLSSWGTGMWKKYLPQLFVGILMDFLLWGHDGELIPTENSLLLSIPAPASRSDPSYPRPACPTLIARRAHAALLDEV
jgi:hypothetical protein